MSARSSSSNRGDTSSTASGGIVGEKPSYSLLRQIKEKFFNVDLIQAIREDTTICFGFKNLLKKVDVINTYEEVSQVLISLSFLLYQLQFDYVRK